MKSRLDLQLWMKDWGSPEDLPPAHFRSYLGILRNDGDPGAVEFLREFPEWVDREPRAVGDYLAAMTREPRTKCVLDPDWLVDMAIGRTTTKDIEAGQLHLCRVLTEYRLDSLRGRSLLEYALDRPVLTGHPVLGAWAVRAWASSHVWTKGDAIEVIDCVGHVDYKRSAIAGFHDRRPSKPEALRARARAEPEIAPAVEYALAS